MLTQKPSGPIGPNVSLSTPGSRALAAQAKNSVISIINSDVITGSCAKCVAGLEVAKGLALAAPWEVPNAMIDLCNQFDFSVSSTFLSVSAVLTHSSPHVNLHTPRISKEMV